MILIIAAAVAIVLANSPLEPLYARLLSAPVAVGMGTFAIDKPLVLWINDGLMAVFFLLIGLEVKREFIGGELSNPRQAALPLMCALGGVAVPALIYLTANGAMPVNHRGWAIPTATDIAFTLAVLALFGSRVPASLKIFVSALAIIDDIAAIAIIAVFYANDLSAVALAVAALCIAALALANWFGVRRLSVYLAIGAVLWVAVLKSGVHATLAGVVLAMAIPIKADANGYSPLVHLEHKIHGWVQIAILPIFAFANAGVKIGGLTAETVFSALTVGIAAGLFAGKQIGVVVTALIARAIGLAALPTGATFPQFYGAAILTGVGFTMSLFIGELAFIAPEQIVQVKLGVLAGSLLSALVGAAVLVFATRR